ncbi:ABC transporter permease [Niallia circulans]|uniref:ABC transporter permease n=1 Tax=Niallia circulans TaxID=1397 RepID=UPI00148F75E4|nr:ABC transporter permease [Niallia circulans]QJX64383.1 ABC transporter permease [Niallia circulans]
MIGLVQNELIKIWEKKNSWIFPIILLFALIGGSFLETKITPQYKGDDWRAKVQAEINELEQKLPTAETEDTLMKSGKDFDWDDTKESIETKIQDYQNNLKQDVSPYSNTWSNMNGIVIGMKSLVTLFVVIICAGSVSSEFSDGTIKQLLIRPYKRWAILLSKYIALLIYTAILIAFLMGVGYLVSIVFFGVGNFEDKVLVFGTVDQIVASGGPFFLKSILYYLPGLLFVLTLSFMLSTLFKNQAIAVGVGVFILFVSSTIGQLIQSLAEKYVWLKLLVFPHLDQTVFLFKDKIIETITMPMSLGILFIYYAIIMIITFWFFKKKDVSI